MFSCQLLPMLDNAMMSSISSFAVPSTFLYSQKTFNTWLPIKFVELKEDEVERKKSYQIYLNNK